MARKYTLKRRAEQQAETRQRIVEAAVELHGSLGPARTTLTMVAERAGVQRHTLYAHFPDERSLLLACSGHFMERNPMPDATPWQTITDRGTRLRTGLGAVYGWYETNAEMIAHVTRDAETDPVLHEISEMRHGPHAAAWVAVLGDGLGGTAAALLRLALGFPTWRTLARDAGLGSTGAAEAMTEAILGAEASAESTQPITIRSARG